MEVFPFLCLVSYVPADAGPGASNCHAQIRRADQIGAIRSVQQIKPARPLDVAMQSGLRGPVLRPGHADARLVESVGRRIVAALPRRTNSGYTGHLAGLQWEFLVVQSRLVEAYALPGGKVVVNTGAHFRLCSGTRASSLRSSRLAL